MDQVTSSKWRRCASCSRQARGSTGAGVDPARNTCLPQQAYAAPADCPARRLAKLQAFAGRQRTLKTDACAVGLPVLACPRGPVRDPVHLCASARWAVATKNPAKRPPTRPAPSRQRPPSLALSATSRCRAAAAMCRFLVLPGRRMRASQPAGRMQAGWRRWSGGHWRRQRLQHSPVPHSLSFASSLSYRCIAGNTYIGVGTAMSRRCCLACTTPLNHRRRCPPFRRACSADYPAHLHSPPQRAPWSRCLRVAGSLAPGLHPPSPPPCLPACLPARPIAGLCSVRHRLPCDRWGTDSGWRRRQGAALLRQSLSIAGVLRRRRRRCR